MKVLVTNAVHNMGFEERPTPKPGPGEVLVRPRAIGLCGSDIHLYNGTHPYRTYPNVFGHELSAWVSELGEGVTGFRQGDHVTLEPYVYCGECYPCRIGRTNCCSRMRTIGVTVPGAFADYAVLPAGFLHQLPKGLDPKVASMCEPFGVGFHAAARGNVQAGERVFVIGMGPIGQAVLSGAKARGAQVAVSDLIDRRLEIAKAMGADLTINSSQSDPVPIVREWTGGDMAHVVFEAVGHPKTIESTIQLVADAGRVVIVGVTEQHASIRGVDMTKKELTICGSRNNLGRFQDAIDFLVNNAQRAAKLVTHVFPFSRAVEAFDFTEKHPDQVCKVVVDFEA